MPSDLAAKLDALLNTWTDCGVLPVPCELAIALAAVARDAAALMAVTKTSRVNLIFNAEDALDASLAALAKEIGNG